jgi:hypothetical protein
MVAASVLYNAKVTDTAAIITALSTNAASTLIVIPTANGQGVLILKQGS